MILNAPIREADAIEGLISEGRIDGHQAAEFKIQRTREDELLALAGAIDIVYFPEARRSAGSGRYDLSLVEGSITTAAALYPLCHRRVAIRHWQKHFSRG